MSMITIGSRIPYFNHATRVSHIFTAIERVSTIQFSSHYYWYSFIICNLEVIANSITKKASTSIRTPLVTIATSSE